MARQFDDGRYTTTLSSDFTSAWTFYGWVYVASLTSRAILTVRNTSALRNEQQLAITNTGFLEGLQGYSSADVHLFSDDAFITAGKWWFVAVVFDGTLMSMYSGDLSSAVQQRLAPDENGSGTRDSGGLELRIGDTAGTNAYRLAEIGGVAGALTVEELESIRLGTRYIESDLRFFVPLDSPTLDNIQELCNNYVFTITNPTDITVVEHPPIAYGWDTGEVKAGGPGFTGGTLGLITETDTAQPMPAGRFKSIGLAVET